MNYGSKLLAGLIFMLCSPVLAVSVVGEGRAHVFFEQQSAAQQQATKNAWREALEKSVKNYLDEKALAKHWSAINSQIYAQPENFIIQQELLSSQQERSDWVVKAQVEVDQNKLKQLLYSISTSKRTSQQSFQTLVRSSKIQDQFLRHALLTSTEQALKQEFLQAGLYASTEKPLSQGLNSRQAIQQLQNTDLLVELDILQVQPSDNRVQLHAQVTVYRVRNNVEVVKKSHRQSYSLSIAIGQPGRQQAIQDIVLNAVQLLASRSAYHILNFYNQQPNVFSYTLIFTKLNDSAKKQLLTLLTELKAYVDHQVVRDIPSLLSLQYKTTVRVGRFKNQLLALAKEQKILLKPQLSSVKSRLVFESGG